MAIEPLVVRLVDGQPVAENWPLEIEVDNQLLKGVPVAVAGEAIDGPPYLRMWATGNGFHVFCANGAAQYRMVSQTFSGWYCQRVALTESTPASPKGDNRE